ncbi:unnamed protein product, partial [Mesorhabditis spiculigera]
MGDQEPPSSDQAREPPEEATFAKPALPVSAPSKTTNEEAKPGEVPKQQKPPIKSPGVTAILKYEPPSWACKPEEGVKWEMEVIKQGNHIETFDLAKRKNDTFVTIGRIPDCDIKFDHLSLSRYHAILQYGLDHKSGKKCWHLYDLGSSHGTKANRQKVPERQWIRVRIGWVLSFAMSTRYLMLKGPEDEKDAEWELSPTEMNEKMKRKAVEDKLAAEAKEEFERRKREDEKEQGVDWGMRFEDDAGDSGLMHLDGNDAHLMEDHEAYYRDDPRKALAKFFDREGFDMEFTYSESGVNSSNHKWICHIELPVDLNGRTLKASATVSTSKKDAQAQCALEACRLLDSHGVLRKSTSRAKIKKRTLEEDDYYEEDDDEYFDRTGDVTLKQERRKNRALGITERESKTHTYESILADLENSKKEITELNERYEKLNATTDLKVEDGQESLVTKQDDQKTKTEKSQIRLRLADLTYQVQRMEQLAKIAKPVSLSEMKNAEVGKAGDRQAFYRKMMQLGKKQKLDEQAAQPSTASQGPAGSTTGFVPEVDDEVAKPAKAEPSAAPPQEFKMPIPAARQGKPKAEPKPEKKKEPEMSKKFAAHLEELESINMTEEEKKYEQEHHDEQAEKQRRKRNQRSREERKKVLVVSGTEYGEGMEDKDDKYATWLPPDSQSGDGSTRLNDKFAGRY